MCMSVSLYVSVCLYVCLSVGGCEGGRWSVCLSVCLCLSVCMYGYVSVCLSVFVCLSVCLCVSVCPSVGRCKGGRWCQSKEIQSEEVGRWGRDSLEVVTTHCILTYLQLLISSVYLCVPLCLSLCVCVCLSLSVSVYYALLCMYIKHWCFFWFFTDFELVNKKLEYSVRNGSIEYVFI